MLNAAQLAVFDVADQHFELMPRDTGSNEAGAEAAARDALATGAQLLIGPVFAKMMLIASNQSPRWLGINMLWPCRPTRRWPIRMFS